MTIVENNIPLKKDLKPLKLITTSHGFTLVEAILSVALLVLLGMAISVPYISGFQALDAQADSVLLDSAIRHRMESLMGTKFSSLANGSEVVTIRGQNYTIIWTIVNADLDGDATPENTVKQVTVSVTELPNRSLRTIMVDNEGKLGKIS